MATVPTRRRNLLALFTEFVAQRQAADPSAPLAGMDKAFAEQLQVHNTYLSGMKSGARGIGHKLARQIEHACGKPRGWLDEEHDGGGLASFMELAQRAYLQASPERRSIFVQMLAAPAP